MIRRDRSFDKIIRLFIYLCFFIVLTYIASQTPYCHDEWKWGHPERVELMKQGFRNYNGRYLGNIFALLITRSEFIKTIMISGWTTLLLYVMERCICKKNDRYPDKALLKTNFFLLVMSVILLLAVPQTLYAQSYGWPAAFVNFVPPVILFLLYYSWTEQIYGKNEEFYSKLQMFAGIPLAIASQLFSEHITIFIVLYAVWVMVYSKIVRKNIHKFHILYFLGAAAGMFIMFSNGAYGRAASNPTTYKHISLSVGTMFEQLCNGILEPLFYRNWLLNILLTIVLSWMVSKSKQRKWVNIEMMIVYWGFSLYSVLHQICPEWKFFGNEFLNQGIELLIAGLFFVNVCMGIWMYGSQKYRLNIMILYFGFAISAVPLLAAKPIGDRCFYICYILECVVLLKLIQAILEEGKAENLFYSFCVLGVTAVVLAVFYVRIFSVIGAVDDQRKNTIAYALENELEGFVLPVLPYSGYTWTTEPQNEDWEKYFKEFYNIPTDVMLEFQ